MKTRGIIGARIVRVDQTRQEMYSGSVWNIDRIVLDNGRVLTFIVAEGDGCYAIEGVNSAPTKGANHEQAK